MYAGRIVETGRPTRSSTAPRHAYTYGLLSSLARLDQRRGERLEPIPGQPPSLSRVPQRLRVPPAVRVRHRRLPHGGPGAGRAGPADHWAAATTATGRRPGERSAAAQAVGRAGRRERTRQAGLPVTAPKDDASGASGDRPDDGSGPARPARRRAAAQVTDLVKHFPIRSGIADRAGRSARSRPSTGVSFSVAAGQHARARRGESGCGKSTTARAVLRLHRAHLGHRRASTART